MFGLLSACLMSAVLAKNSVVVSEYPTFEQWSSDHGLSYSATEHGFRENIYYKNIMKIAKHNTHNHPYRFGLNKFTAMTRNEFSKMFSNGYINKRVRNYTNTHTINTNVLPSSVDWTSKGAVSPVKNQGQCGSCWAFSATGATEGAWFLSNKTLLSLSEQQLVDCSKAEGNNGCNGGLMDDAFSYIMKNGLTTEAAYPYTGRDGSCIKVGSSVKISGYKDVPANSQLALMSAIAQQPVSVAIEADQDVFQFYSSGVMTASCGNALDHGVLAVGYGRLGSLDYYKVKNSWGADWGMNGYILLGRGPQYGAAGQCGVQMDPSYPVM